MARSYVRPRVNTGRVGRPGGRTRLLIDWAIETSKAFQLEQIAKNRVASGKSLESWEVDVRDVRHVNLSAAEYLGTIIAEKSPMGRRPTSVDGGGSVFKSILRWIAQRGLRPDPGQTLLSLARAITATIHKYGTTLFRSQSTSDAVSLDRAIDTGFNNVDLDKIASQIAEEAGNKIVVDLTRRNKNLKVTR